MRDEVLGERGGETIGEEVGSGSYRQLRANWFLTGDTIAELRRTIEDIGQPFTPCAHEMWPASRRCPSQR